MDFLILVLFIPACFALNMIPGPNNLLSMANAQRYGFKYAVGAGIGRIFAFVVMIFLAATGLATVLYASETIFLTIKIIGAVYLFWVAFKLWNSKTSEVEEQKEHNNSIYLLAKQEFLLAAGNPKAILIFTAFLPQFIDANQSSGSQFFILGATFLLLEFLAISVYAIFGVYLRNWFSKPNMKQLFNRFCAFFIGSIGISLLIERKV
ncbi:lysine transporter LysE [Pseudoalteromonas sp. MSK9-3]|uniref:LysE family translocator n=1 Tax=Pseudoalteromonas sp. MSK9-3 TaxID=1897633 RepID=UPI000E6CC28A|nr:LysE family translocator [Pseudoalteromonas sp. MSK9-3]RJE77592.1 lysine transporter LysE [Pseudoalteromonas sp. MSK9-3]